MRIKSDEVVAGFPARKIRELLRQSVDCISARHATKILEIKTKQAIRLLERLEQGGLLERNPALPNSDDEQSWKRTVKGGTRKRAVFDARVPAVSREKDERVSGSCPSGQLQ